MARHARQPAFSIFCLRGSETPRVHGNPAREGRTFGRGQRKSACGFSVLRPCPQAVQFGEQGVRLFLQQIPVAPALYIQPDQGLCI